MATRAQIGFYEKEPKTNKEIEKNHEALIYRHWDGNPESVLEDITPILKDFDKKRGLDDIEYASAWLVAKLKDDYTDIGISKNLHGDIEYLYVIFNNKMNVYSVKTDWETDHQTFILEKRLSLNK